MEYVSHPRNGISPFLVIFLKHFFNTENVLIFGLNIDELVHDAYVAGLITFILCLSVSHSVFSFSKQDESKPNSS